MHHLGRVIQELVYAHPKADWWRAEDDWRALCYCRRIGEAEALARELGCTCYYG